MMELAPAQDPNLVPMQGGTEPRMFPGVLHETHRRYSLRPTTSGSESAMESSTTLPAVSNMTIQENRSDEAMEES